MRATFSGRQSPSLARDADLGYPRQVCTKLLAVEEQQGRQRLLVRRGRQAAPLGQPAEEPIDLGLALDAGWRKP